MPNLADIANAAGVSTAVVSRVINRDATLRISEKTRERVLKVVEEFDYTPNIAARSLRSAKSGLIALVMHDLTNPVYAEIMRGAQHAVSQFGNALLLFDTLGPPEGASRLVDMIAGGGVDGLILQATGSIADKVLVTAARQQIPTVLLQAELDIDAHLISLPDEQASRIATEHLVELGHRKIGCLATVKDLTFTRRRELGWFEALQAANIPHTNRNIVYCNPNIEEGAVWTAELLDRNPDITAIVCFNVMAAIGALQTIDARGLKVPKDISVIALLDIKLAGFLKTPLTTVDMPLFELGRSAANVVVDIDLYKSGSTVIDTISPRLVLRESTAPLKK